MKRNKFILAAVALASTPIIGISQNRRERTDKGFKVNAGEGRIHGHIKLRGVNENILDVKISGSDTDGGFALFEQISLSPGRGTPLHLHHFQDEVFYVVEGAYYFQVGEDKYHLGAGDSIFLPKNIPHAWTQVSEKGKMTVLFQPAGKMETFFVSLSSFQHEPSREELLRLFGENEMQIVGPPLRIE